MSIKTRVAISVALCVALYRPALAHKVGLDSGLYTAYSATETSVSFTVCGYLKESDGCYGSAMLGPFTSECAVVEGKSRTAGDVITRAIYVLDRGALGDKQESLYVYSRTDTITDTDDTVEVSFVKQVPLRLAGGNRSACAMAANDYFVYAGTSADTKAAIIDQKTLTVTHSGGFTPPEHLVSITADDRGCVAINFSDGNAIYDPTGAETAGGGGEADMVGTRNAWKPMIKQ